MQNELKDNLLYVYHIYDAAISIVSFVQDIDEAEFVKNRLVQSAVIRGFEIIGEATKRMTMEFRAEHPHIPWRKMAAFRDVLIHDYSGVDYWYVWGVVTQNIPPLVEQLEKIMIDNGKGHLLS